MQTEIDSGLLPLECQPRATQALPPRWRRRVEALAVIACLFCGGFGLGFVYASRVGDAELARARDDHQGEIERLQHAWGTQLKLLSGRVGDAAQAAGEAATTAQAAATTAARAANAAKDAKK